MTSGAGLPADGGPVEGYLDLLLVTFSGPPRQVRRMLAEAEAHLREAVDEGLAAGLSAQQAEAAAVRRMGPVHAITGNGAFFLRPTAALARRLAVGGSLVAGVGLVAVGVAGAIAWLLAALYGGQFVTAPFPAGSYTRADCARWLAGDPAAHGCLQAMTADHLGDVVLQAAAGGVLGLIALAVHVMLRRRWRDRATLTVLPRGSTEALGAALALLAVVIGAGGGMDLVLVQHGLGAGQMFSLALAAVGAALFFGFRFWRTAAVRAA